MHKLDEQHKSQHNNNKSYVDSLYHKIQKEANAGLAPIEAKWKQKSMSTIKSRENQLRTSEPTEGATADALRQLTLINPRKPQNSGVYATQEAKTKVNSFQKKLEESE